MTVSTRDATPRFVICFALLLFAWTHRHALGMSGFADDLGLLADLSARAQQGSLLVDVLRHVSEPLWPGSTMWRPLPYASFALDAALWGADGGLWHITNLLLHLACATVAGLICRDMTLEARAGAAGFAVFLLIPWSPEVVIWLVGRFDGWAALGVLTALWAALKSNGLDRWWLLSLCAGACAYASKESALILPVWIAVITLNASYRAQAADGSTRILLARRVLSQTFKKHGTLIAAHAMLALAYLLWRASLFSASSLNVYATAPELSIVQLGSRVWEHLRFPLGLLPLSPIAAWIAGVCAVLAIALASRSEQRSCALVGAVFIATVVAAVAAYFPAAPGDGDGYRLYYLATIGIALIAASASTSPSRIAPLVLLALLGALATWQAWVSDEWSRASREMKGSEAALRRTAIALPPQDYGLVLLPDHMAHVPFARNAQGALPKLSGLAAPTVDVLNHLVAFTPPQIDEWHRLAQQDVVRKITSRDDAPARPTQYFCYDPRTQNLQALGFWDPGTLEDWRRKWRESVAATCRHNNAVAVR